MESIAWPIAPKRLAVRKATVNNSASSGLNQENFMNNEAQF